MLKNDPPPGTKIKFLRDVREAKSQETATLVRAMREYETDRPEDEFEIEYRGEQMIVQRQDIE
jgi:hypothetical protein